MSPLWACPGPFLCSGIGAVVMRPARPARTSYEAGCDVSEGKDGRNSLAPTNIKPQKGNKEKPGQPGWMCIVVSHRLGTVYIVV
jgi:hypothetical protein